MDNTQKKIVEEKIIEYMFELSFKSILETYYEIYNMYDNDEITSDDFYNILDELKNKLIK